MSVKRFSGKNSREALNLVRQSLGADAVVISTRPCAEGVEVLAMAPDAVHQFEQVAQPAAKPAKTANPAAAKRPAGPAADATSVDQDAQALSMSTLSFQDYVRERMLRRRRAEIAPATAVAPTAPAVPVPGPRPAPRVLRPEPPVQDHLAEAYTIDVAPPAPSSAAVAALDLAARREQFDMLGELRSMRGLIEERFSALAFLEKLQRQPRQAQLAQRLLDAGFSPALTRKLCDGLPADLDEMAWAASVLERNLATGEHDDALEDAGGVYALIGATGVGKTTSTAKLAAAFAAKHGAANLGLITLDAYRVAAHEQLRTYGRILGVPVHTAHDRASLEDLLELLSGKRMVLIDTAGMAQRDSRTRELLEMLSQRSIQKLLVLAASAQGETIEDQIVAYQGSTCRGVVLSKLDEAVKTGPALDALIRHRVKLMAVANGQRVPEDWHRLGAAMLVQRALRAGSASAWRIDDAEVRLVFAGVPPARSEAGVAAAGGR